MASLNTARLRNLTVLAEVTRVRLPPHSRRDETNFVTELGDAVVTSTVGPPLEGLDMSRDAWSCGRPVPQTIRRNWLYCPITPGLQRGGEQVAPRGPSPPTTAPMRSAASTPFWNETTVVESLTIGFISRAASSCDKSCREEIDPRADLRRSIRGKGGRNEQIARTLFTCRPFSR